MDKELALRTFGYLIGHYKTHNETTINKQEIEAIEFMLKINEHLEQQVKKQKEVIDKAIEFLFKIKFDKTDKYICISEYIEYQELLDILKRGVRMSICETSITNPKKQLEFYKQLSEQLQQENKILKENAENNDKVVDKVNWENQLLKKENKQLKDKLSKIETLIINHNRNIGDIYYKYNSKFLKSELKQRILEIVYEVSE